MRGPSGRIESAIGIRHKAIKRAKTKLAVGIAYGEIKPYRRERRRGGYKIQHWVNNGLGGHRIHGLRISQARVGQYGLKRSKSRYSR